MTFTLLFELVGRRGEGRGEKGEGRREKGEGRRGYFPPIF
jgi:hypothetical protein